MAVTAGLTLSNDKELEGLVRGSGAKVVQVDLEKIDAPGIDKLEVLVVDLRNAEHLPDALAGFRKKHPQIGVIIVTSALDRALMLEALRAGVNECVTAPLQQDDFTGAIDRLMGQRAESSKPGDVFAFLGAKGGVGTTTWRSTSLRRSRRTRLAAPCSSISTTRMVTQRCSLVSKPVSLCWTRWRTPTGSTSNSCRA